LSPARVLRVIGKGYHQRWLTLLIGQEVGHVKIFQLPITMWYIDSFSSDRSMWSQHSLW
jgi:hypothetical protein